MTTAARAREPRPLAAIRRWLGAIVVAGSVGMGIELLLIGHVEDAAQLIPLVLLAAGAAVVGWEAVSPRATLVRITQATMLLFVLSGGVGIALHYQGNVEFELEMYPDMAGRELMAKTLTGATPVLAPGSMALLGLVGLVHTYRHPVLSGANEA